MDTGIDEQINQLSLAEKIELVEELWDAIAAEAAMQPVSETVKAEMSRRWAAHRANPDSAIPWEVAKAHLENRLP